MGARIDGPTQPASPVSKLIIEGDVIEALRTVFDPEIPVNIYEMGLVYGITVGDTGDVVIEMTLTSPMCPVAESLPAEVEEKVRQVTGVTGARVEITWDPPWSPDRMSEEAKLELGLW